MLRVFTLYHCKVFVFIADGISFQECRETQLFPHRSNTNVVNSHQLMRHFTAEFALEGAEEDLCPKEPKKRMIREVLQATFKKEEKNRLSLQKRCMTIR